MKHIIHIHKYLTALAFYKKEITIHIYKTIRPSSAPYISGDGFRRFANYVYDETNHNIDPKKIKKNEIVFISTNLLPEYFHKIHPNIDVPYKIISHNSDYQIDDKTADFFDEKITTWFAQNVNYIHPRIIPIPIGLENLHYLQNGDIKLIKNMQNSKIVPSKNRIFVNFSINTNFIERNYAYNTIKYSKCADIFKRSVTEKEYLQNLRSYKFILSPPGNGLDCHRTWEAMYQQVIPIVKYSPAMNFFQKLGLPLWIVNDWNELLSLDETFLSEKYNQMKENFNNPALYLDFWKKVIYQPDIEHISNYFKR
jgi:hypothetical protein